MRLRDRLQRIDRDRPVAVGAVLDPHRHRQAACHLAVRLGLRGTRADRAPGDQVRKVLRRDRIERLGRARQAEGIQIEEQLARDVQPLFDVKRIVESYNFV